MRKSRGQHSIGSLAGEGIRGGIGLKCALCTDICKYLQIVLDKRQIVSIIYSVS